MSGFPDVGYTTVAHYALLGELYTFPACPLDHTCVAALPTLKRLQTKVRPNFYCLGLALCNHLATSRLDVLHTFPSTICVRLVGIPCAPYRMRLFFPLRLEGGTILHDLTLVFQFSCPELRVFSPRTTGFLAPTLGFAPTLGVPTRPSGVSRPDPRGFLQEKLRLRQSLVLFYAVIGIYHWFLFDMLYTLRKIF